MNLYNLTKEMIELDELLASAENPEDPSIHAAIQKALWLQDQREAKVDAYCCLISEIAARASARKAEADRLYENAVRAQNTVSRLKTSLLESFNAMGISKLETERFTVSIAKNGGPVPLELDPNLDAKTLPESLQKITITPDNEKIRAALSSGEALPFAKLGIRGQHVRIK